MDAARSARRQEMLRLACGDLLGLISVTNIARGLTSVAETTIARRATTPPSNRSRRSAAASAARLAVIGMGRLGGAELGYSSDADVMYVFEPLPGEDPERARADATAAADLMARLLGRPSPDPPLEIDANLRPEGTQRPAGPHRWTRTAATGPGSPRPGSGRRCCGRGPVAGDEELGAQFIAAADAFRYPDGGLSQRDVVEIRRIKARVDTERLPRGADPTTHTKLGRGGLGRRRVDRAAAAAAARVRGCRTCGRRPRCRRSSAARHGGR